MKSKTSTTIFSPFCPLILFLIISHSSLTQPHAINTIQNLELVIGGEAPPPEIPVCPEPLPPPPPPPEECPPPPPPPPPEECPPPPPPPTPKPPPPPPPSPPPPPPPPTPKPPPPPPPPPSPKPPSPPPPTPKPPLSPSPPPPTPRPPIQPPPLLPLELLRAVKVIQKFKATIGNDPLGVTDTWNGRICFDKTKYRGFICDTTVYDDKIRVALVNFNGFNLTGKPNRPLALRNFLDGLTDIIVFNSNSNNFAGGVPTTIKTVPSLFELDLSNNKLAGNFPREVLTATSLTFLDLRYNMLTGTIPPAVFSLDLDVLFLNNNYFSGQIPDALGKTPSVYVTLANNRLTGNIPATIGNLSKTLLEILLLGNRLSGCLPYEIGFLTKATVFDASVNAITGPLPLSLGCLKSMVYLNMSMNSLNGAVPEDLCRVRGLLKLTLSWNYITEVGPYCRKLIRKGVLDLGMNCVLDLPNQRSKKVCEDFFLKHKSCPNPASMNIVPCSIDHYSQSQSESEVEGNDDLQVERKLMDLPRTYAALELHH